MIHEGRRVSGIELLPKPYSRAALVSRLRHVLNQPPGSGRPSKETSPEA